MNKIETINDFTEIVKESPINEFPDCDIKTTTTQKNNGINLTSITIRPKDSKVAPSVHMNKYFIDFQAREPIEEILNQIIDECRTAFNSPEMEISS